MSSLEDLDDGDNLQGGDLGLGLGLKPGGIPVRCQSDDEFDNDRGGVQTNHNSRTFRDPIVTSLPVDQICSNCKNTSLYIIKCSECRQSSLGDRAAHQIMQQLTKPVQKMRFLKRSKSDLEDRDINPEPEDYQVTGEIPLGTSIRQQKKLYEKNRKELFDQGQELDMTNQTKKNSEKQHEGKEENGCSDAQVKRLTAAEREVEMLRYELESCKKVSDSRCKAMRLFKGHSYAIQSQQFDTAKKANRLNKTLQAEINQLQFELEYREASVMTSQESWTERFSKISSENQSLITKMTDQSESMRKLQAEKTALLRERDELLALLDIQERQRYESTRSQSSEDTEYNNFSSTELAVLGACRCRIHSPQPCGCAHAAAYMKREIARLRGELNGERQKSSDALILADAYRIAFEEQLNRNSRLMRRLVDASSFNDSQPQASKPRAALRWLIKQLNEEDYLPVTIKGNQATKANHLPKVSSKATSPEVLSDPPSETTSETTSEKDTTKGNEESCPPSTEEESASEETEDGTETTRKDKEERQTEENGKEEKERENNGTEENENGGSNTDVSENGTCEGHHREASEGVEGACRRGSEEMPSPGGGRGGGGEGMGPKSYRYDELIDALQNKKDEELINMLIEMINDRTEALAHQRLAARMLAKRLTEMEGKLSAFTDDVFDK